MIGDKLTYYPSLLDITSGVISKLRHEFVRGKRLCIAIGGESGCGKTSLAYTLKIDIEKALGLKGYMFHADDYFFLPPKDNHNKRLENISNVGIKEVNLKLLDQHILQFNQGKSSLKKPLVNYSNNAINSEVIDCSSYDFCIVEGTYTLNLHQPAFKIFMSASYKETKQNREDRARDLLNDFNERVLEIEHHIIQKHSHLAHLIV